MFLVLSALQLLLVWLGSLMVACQTGDYEVTGLTLGHYTPREQPGACCSQTYAFVQQAV